VLRVERVTTHLADVLQQARQFVEWFEADDVRHEAIENFREYLDAKQDVAAEVEDFKDMVWVCSPHCPLGLELLA
jgi:hypothetical protein